MREYYFHGLVHGEALAEFFSLPKGIDYSEIRKRLLSGGPWTGRVVTVGNRHGISSVEVMLHLDEADSRKVWLYTMEHPSVDGVLRFSSRSEMKILQVLLDNTLEYVFLRDMDGRFIITNQAFRSAVAVDADSSPVGETIDAFISRESANWVREIDARVYETGLPSVNRVSRFVFNNGTTQWLQMTTVPVRNSEGEIVGSVSVARDISDLKRTESELRTAIQEAKAASRAKGEFLAAISHEIRTPINGIVGASELCQETRLDAEQRDYLNTVVQCSSTLLALVNDVLDFSKIEAGQLNLEKLNFCPVALLENVADEFAQVIRKKGIELVVGYDEKLPKYLMGDPTRVKQILYNLLGNAVKFTDSGEITIRADVLVCGDKHAKIRFSVSDSGIGIPESRRVAIFSSFTQADMSTTRKYGGSGLGLSICKELVDLMGGSIEVNSEVGRGSTFNIEIPFELTEHYGAEAIPFNPELAGLRVLIADDNETNRDIFRQMCAGWGYRGSCAKDGLEALSILEEAARCGEPYQLLLLDQQMPGLDGLDLASLIDRRPNLRGLRILLLSSSLDRSETERAEQLGIARALSKPIKRSTLLEVILETFEVRGASDRASPAVANSAYQKAEGGRGLNVLLAEDNEVNQNIAIRRLEKLGHRVTVASTGVLVLELLKQEAFDCILMDIQMPEMDGYETTFRIRELEAEERREPAYIIAMTAHAMKGDRERCLEVGMDDYLSKPFRVERLKEVLSDVRVTRGGAVDLNVRDTSLGHADSFKEYLAGMGDEEREDLYAVAEVFLRTIPEDIRRLESALAERDFKEIYYRVHSMKGVTGIFNGQSCVDLAQRIEVACNQKDFEEAHALSLQLIRAVGRLSEEVEDELASQC